MVLELDAKCGDFGAGTIEVTVEIYVLLGACFKLLAKVGG